MLCLFSAALNLTDKNILNGEHGVRFLTKTAEAGADNSQRPKFDLHTLFTCSQMSQIKTQGQLSVHEPWRRHKKKPKCVYVCLYTNDSSPFIAWYADKGRKKPRGFFNIQGGRIAPIGEFSFQIAFEEKTSTQVYKFNTECWEKREEWLYSLREESRKEVPTIQNFGVTDPLTQSQDDLNIGKASCTAARPAWKRHRRTLSAGSSVQHSTPQLEQCQVHLQRSRSQPHIQKGKMVRKRPSVLEKQPQHALQQTMKARERYIRSPEVSRS